VSENAFAEGLRASKDDHEPRLLRVSSSLHVRKNLPGNQALRKIVHASEVFFRALITADMRAWPAMESINLEEIIWGMPGKKTESGGGGTKEYKKLFAEG
jgi:hypothetical protein